MNKIISKIVSNDTSMLGSTNGRDWDTRKKVTLFRALDEKGREVMFDITKESLVKRLTQSGYRINQS